MATQTLPTFDPAIAVGARKELTTVGVDAGTMCIATRFPDDDDWMGGHGSTWSGDRWGCTVSGWGDGGYALLTITAPGAEAPHGVEVVFLSPTLEGEAYERALLSTAKLPTDTQRHDAWGRDIDPDVRAAAKVIVDAWSQALDTEYLQMWNERIATLDPAADADPRLFTVLDVPDTLGVGDPCYGGASAEITVQPGRYALVGWIVGTQQSDDDLTSATGRVARFGAYRLP